MSYGQEEETNMLGGSYLKLDQMHARTLQARIQEYRTPRYQAMEDRSKALIELTELNKQYAIDQTDKVDVLTKNLKEAKTAVRDTGSELEKFKEDNKVDNKKLLCYSGVLFCVLVGIFTLNYLVTV